MLYFNLKDKIVFLLLFFLITLACSKYPLKDIKKYPQGNIKEGVLTREISVETQVGKIKGILSFFEERTGGEYQYIR